MRPGPNPYAPIVTGYKNQDEFAEKLGRVMFQVSRDVLDLPSEIYTLRYGYLGAEARRIYRELDKEFITWLSDTEAAFAANALTKFTRLQQVANGFVKDENGLIHTLDDGKAELLRDTLSEIPGEPVPVFGWSYPTSTPSGVSPRRRGGRSTRYRDVSTNCLSGRSSLRGTAPSSSCRVKRVGSVST